MKNNFKILVLGSIFFITYLELGAMEKKDGSSSHRGSKDSSKQRTSSIGSESQGHKKNPDNKIVIVPRQQYIKSDVSVKHSGQTPILGSGRNHHSHSSKPKTSSRPVHHTLVLIGADHMPIKTINLGAVVSDCYNNLSEALKLFNAEAIVIIEAEDENSLDEDCNNKLVELFKKHKIIELIVHPKKDELPYDNFRKIMEEHSDIVVTIYALSNNTKCYEYLVRWSIPITIRNMKWRDDEIPTEDGGITTIPVIFKTMDDMSSLVNYVLYLTYLRVFSDKYKPSGNQIVITEELDNWAKHYLDAKEIKRVKNCCWFDLWDWRDLLSQQPH